MFQSASGSWTGILKSLSPGKSMLMYGERGGITFGSTGRFIMMSKVAQTQSFMKSSLFHSSAISFSNSDDGKKKNNNNTPGSDKTGGDGKDKKRAAFDPDGYSLDLDPKAQKKLEHFKQAISQNSYYEKYKAKVVEKQKASPKSFSTIIDTMISVGKKVVGYDKGKFIVPQKTALNNVMKVEMLEKVEREDLSFIWAEYHRSIRMLAGSMNSIMHDRVVAHGKAHRNFLIPLPRQQGYEYFLVQFADDAFHFTPLIQYQKYKENSPVCLSVVHYTELRETKDIVLMRGEFNKDYLKMDEAATLLIQLNLYYGEPTPRRIELMETFNCRPAEFNHMSLIEELKAMKLEYPHLFPEEVEPTSS